MPKWEYIDIELFTEAQKEGFPDFKTVLNKYGDEGWELVSVTDATLYNGATRITRFFAFFKRQKN